MLEKLKPCPFCGGDVKIINAEELTINYHRSGDKRKMKVKTLIMELLNNTSPEAEVDIEFNKTLLPDDE